MAQWQPQGMNEAKKMETEIGKLNEPKEKNKLRDEILKIVLDKLLLAIILAMVGYFANKSVESYKADLSSQRFMQEKKLEAVLEMKSAFADFADPILKTISYKNEIDTVQIEMAFYECRKRLAKWSFLLSKEQLREVDNCLWSFAGFAYSKRDDWRLYYGFYAQVINNFGGVCRRILGVEDFGGEYKFIRTTDEIVSSDVYEFLDKNAKNWATWDKKKEITSSYK
jgi:hypothetical protein